MVTIKHGKYPCRSMQQSYKNPTSHPPFPPFFFFAKKNHSPMAKVLKLCVPRGAGVFQAAQPSGCAAFKAGKQNVLWHHTNDAVLWHQ